MKCPTNFRYCNSELRKGEFFVYTYADHNIRIYAPTEAFAIALIRNLEQEFKNHA